MTPEEWTAVGTGATALILLITLVYVALQVREARQLRREQFRPWVTVSFHFRSNIALIALRNLGNTAAREVRLDFDPPLASTLDDHRPGEAAMFKRPIPVLVPGEERLALLDRTSDRLRSDLPQTHKATVTYHDHRGDPLAPEVFVLDFGGLEGALIPDKGMHDLVEQVKRIATGSGS